jgi:hypothetical protein
MGAARRIQKTGQEIIDMIETAPGVWDKHKIIPVKKPPRKVAGSSHASKPRLQTRKLVVQQHHKSVLIEATADASRWALQALRHAGPVTAVASGADTACPCGQPSTTAAVIGPVKIRVCERCAAFGTAGAALLQAIFGGRNVSR